MDRETAARLLSQPSAPEDFQGGIGGEDVRGALHNTIHELGR